VVEVAPVPPVTGLKLDPPFVETCHWTVGVGEPDAAALNETGLPNATVWLIGSVVITGALVAVVVTVKVAGFVVVLLLKPKNVASYLYPFCEADAVKE
jgi:hypothetical protein